MNQKDKAKQWIENSNLTASILANAIDSAIAFIDGDTSSYMGEEYQHEVCLEIIADCAAGTYIPQYVADYFDMEIPSDAKDYNGELTTDWREYEWAYDDIESFAQDVADELNNLIGDLNERKGTFYFGPIPDMGDYALFFCWETS